MSNNKYEKAKVYKIWSTQGDKIYIGSTCKEYLSQRMVSHRKDYNGWKNTENRFMSSFLLFDEYGLENCFIELLEAKECKSKDELRKIEGKYIRELECVNKRIAGQTKKEYYENSIEVRKRYYENNKQNISDRQKQYRDDNKEKIAEFQKLYRENNKEVLSDYKKQYRENKIELLTEKIKCECGGIYTHQHKSTHQKTKKHCKFIESQITKPEDDAV
jgi:hypothetical protein